jgi:RHS repeat-associated protein
VGGLVLTRHADPVGGTKSFVPAYDGSGNVIALIDTVSGQRGAEYEFGPFGELLRSTGTVARKNPIQWSTKYHDIETGNIAYEFRYYAPTSGRWLSRDPIGEAGGVNLFGFCNNNPGGMIDAFGAYCVDLTLDPPTPREARPAYAHPPRQYKNTRWGWTEPKLKITCKCDAKCDIKCNISATMNVKISTNHKGVNDDYFKRTGAQGQTEDETFGHEQLHIHNVYTKIREEVKPDIEGENVGRDCARGAKALEVKYQKILDQISADEMDHGNNTEPVRGAPYPPLKTHPMPLRRSRRQHHLPQNET